MTSVAPVRPALAIAARIALWGLVGAGALGGVVAGVRPVPVASPPHAPVEVVPDPSVVGFAELATERWVAQAGDASGVSSLDPLAAPEPGGRGGFAAMGRGLAVATRHVRAGRWAVTVAIDVVERVHDQALAPQRWFVEVLVERDAAGRSALAAAPGLVAAPAIGSSEQGPLWRSPGRDDPLAGTVTGFAGALLAGAGDVSRYVAPGTVVEAVSPPPFASVTLERIATEVVSADLVHVRALVRGRTASSNDVFASYDLDLRRRAGRWEIAAVTGAAAHGTPARRSTTSQPATEPGA
jgi:hypothetical protein